jgi:hypothetical protein
MAYGGGQANKGGDAFMGSIILAQYETDKHEAVRR